MPLSLPSALVPFLLIAAAIVLLVLRERLMGRGPVVQESRPMPPFHTIDCQGDLDVTVVCQQDPHVAVAASADTLTRVRTQVENGVLRVRLRRWGWWQPARKVALDVSLPDLSGMTATGASHVTIANVANRELRIHADGASLYRLSGATGHLMVSGEGAARVEADELAADSVSLDLSGVCTARVHVTERMDVKGSGPIQVAYRGQPRITQQIKGQGSVLPV
jgi:hypothetical protein